MRIKRGKNVKQALESVSKGNSPIARAYADYMKNRKLYTMGRPGFPSSRSAVRRRV